MGSLNFCLKNLDENRPSAALFGLGPLLANLHQLAAAAAAPSPPPPPQAYRSNWTGGGRGVGSCDP